MAIVSLNDVKTFIEAYAQAPGYIYGVVGAVVGIESMGVPLPGETILIAAAIFAAHNADPASTLSIFGIVGAAIAGAIIGDNIGYLLGRRFGYPFLLRHGRKFNITEDRIKLGQYLFMHYGGNIVFFGRFIALLRILAAFLAGVNKMPWLRFLFANASGGIIWACVFGFGGYLLGELIFGLHEKFAVPILAAAVLGFFAIGFLVHRYEKQLIVRAREALPGPLESIHAK